MGEDRTRSSHETHHRHRWLREWTIALAILCAGAIGRVVLFDFLGFGRGVELPDSQLYERYARSIYLRQPYAVDGDQAQRTPGYPVFLALCWTAFGGESPRSVIIAQSVLLALTGGLALVYLSQSRLERPAGSLVLSAVLLVLEPYSTVISSLLLSETLFTTLFVASLAGYRAFAQSNLVIGNLIIGVISGLAMLVRPSVLILYGLAWIYVATIDRSTTRRQAAWRSISLLLGFLLATAPWWIRNALLFQAFVPTTLNVGISLADGLNPHASGGSDYRFVEDAALKNQSERERDRVYRSRALAFVREQPLAALRLALVKIARFWSPWPNEQRFQNPLVILATSTIWLLIYAGVIAALLHFRDQAEFLWGCLLPALYFCLLHAVFVSSVRYRVPAAPLLCAAAAIGWCAAAQRWRQWRKAVRT